MAAPAVTVSIEAVHENQIQEVTLDGQEILIPYGVQNTLCSSINLLEGT